jgi:integrase
MLQLPIPLTFYVARHSWASIAYSNQIPVTTISRALGHNNESTTRIYLATLDNTAVELANKKVLESLSF